jgi:hypothetical protein
MLRTSTKWYKPRKLRPLADAVAYMHKRGEIDTFESPLEVLLPVREVAFDTLNPGNNFNVNVLERLDPRLFMKDTDFQITYSFSARRRVNTRGITGGGSYGAPNTTFRQLYDFLCVEYNGGERFIDTYFQRVFPTSPVGRRFAGFEDTVRDAMREEWLMRYSQALAHRQTKAGIVHKATEKKLLREFSVWKSAAVAAMLRQFDKDIRKEIEAMLRSGRIPLRHNNRQATIAARLELGLPGVPEFYATGQLIRDVQVDIRIPEEAFGWW